MEQNPWKVIAMPDIYDALDEVLDTFAWAYQDRDQLRGEVHVDRDEHRLVLIVYVRDSDSLDEEVAPLTVSAAITQAHPQDQIRELIHWYLCHEADEQMWFGQERVFYPH